MRVYIYWLSSNARQYLRCCAVLQAFDQNCEDLQGVSFKFTKETRRWDYIIDKVTTFSQCEGKSGQTGQYVPWKERGKSKKDASNNEKEKKRRHLCVDERQK